MELQIDPYVAVGPVRFGMTAEDARRALPGPAKAFMKTPFSAFPTDAFPNGVHVHYRPPGIVTAVEIFAPASVGFDGDRYLGEPYRVCVASLRRRDPALKEESAACTSRGLGIGLFASGAQKQPDDPVEGVIAFERGYYEHPEWSVNAEKWAEFTARYRPKK